MTTQTQTISAFEAFKWCKFGFKMDPRGAHVLFQGRLYEICDLPRSEVLGLFFQLRHFNGEIGPKVAPSAVRVLVRN